MEVQNGTRNRQIVGSLKKKMCILFLFGGETSRIVQEQRSDKFTEPLACSTDSYLKPFLIHMPVELQWASVDGLLYLNNTTEKNNPE